MLPYCAMNLKWSDIGCGAYWFAVLCAWAILYGDHSYNRPHFLPHLAIALPLLAVGWWLKPKRDWI